MKGLIKNYIENLSLDKLKEFSNKNGFKLTDDELKFILDLVQKNYDDILVNENKYLTILEENINPVEFKKIKELFLYYKNRYKGYLF